MLVSAIAACFNDRKYNTCPYDISFSSVTGQRESWFPVLSTLIVLSTLKKVDAFVMLPSLQHLVDELHSATKEEFDPRTPDTHRGHFADTLDSSSPGSVNIWLWCSGGGRGKAVAAGEARQVQYLWFGPCLVQQKESCVRPYK